MYLHCRKLATIFYLSTFIQPFARPDLYDLNQCPRCVSPALPYLCKSIFYYYPRNGCTSVKRQYGLEPVVNYYFKHWPFTIYILLFPALMEFIINLNKFSFMTHFSCIFYSKFLIPHSGNHCGKTFSVQCHSMCTTIRTKIYSSKKTLYATCASRETC